MTTSPQELQELSAAKLRALNSLQRLVDELLIDRGSPTQRRTIRLDRGNYDSLLIEKLCDRFKAAGWANVTAALRDGATELTFEPKP